MAAFVRPTFKEEEKEKKKDWFGLNYEGTSDRVITRSGDGEKLEHTDWRDLTVPVRVENVRIT